MTIFFIVLTIVLLAVIYVFNSLSSSRVAIREALSGIEIQLKRRADLVPNLVEAVKGYASHESKIFNNVMEARQKLLSASNIEDEAKADKELSSTLKSVFAIAEAYPDLKASTNFASLQSELSDIEAKISYARQFYNNNVKAYNTLLATFPSNMIASAFNFKEEVFFDSEEGVEKPVEVKF